MVATRGSRGLCTAHGLLDKLDDGGRTQRLWAGQEEDLFQASVGIQLKLSVIRNAVETTGMELDGVGLLRWIEELSVAVPTLRDIEIGGSIDLNRETKGLPGTENIGRLDDAGGPIGLNDFHDESNLRLVWSRNRKR